MTDRTFGSGPHPEWPDSLWLDRTVPRHFPSLGTTDSDRVHDIVIVGAGFTGLWTALHIKELDPSRSVTVIDAAQPGYGASGRNGGWCSAMAPMSLDHLAHSTSAATARSFQIAMNRTVAEIGTFVDDHGISCGWSKAGTITLARSRPQMKRVESAIDEARRHGFGDDFLRLLGPDDITERVRVPGIVGASFSPECAVVDPLALCQGLLTVAVASGVSVHGESRLVRHRWSGSRHRLEIATPDGDIAADTDWLLFATEGFTARVEGHRREIAPLYSYMVCTEPLDEDIWDLIGWDNRETITDARRLVVYAQRTQDGRIAFGGRGAPYRFASAIGPRHDTDPAVHDRIIEAMFEFFPAARGARVTHRWGGALGVARDWHAVARVDTTERTGFAGGYVGDGVALSRLAGTAMARGVLGIDDDVTRLPIVGHLGPRWEPEPFRWLGINTMLKMVAAADSYEKAFGRTSRTLDRVIDAFVG